MVMMISSNGNSFRITGPLWRESTGHWWITLKKACDVELWCFLWSTVEETVAMPVIWGHRAHFDVTVMVWTCMMSSSNGNIFCVTGLLCGEFTSHRWIPLTKASDAELRCLLWINGWVNNYEAGDLRCHRTHYDVTVMGWAPTYHTQSVQTNTADGPVMQETRPSPGYQQLWYWPSFPVMFQF